jgi:hypothetical protein
MDRDEMGKDMLSGSMYAREARPHITKGGYHDLDDFCDTCGGLISGHTIGGFIHILLVIAIVVVLIRIIRGRKPF